jgi:RHS repeat-associated protein
MRSLGNIALFLCGVSVVGMQGCSCDNPKPGGSGGSSGASTTSEAGTSDTSDITQSGGQGGYTDAQGGTETTVVPGGESGAGSGGAAGNVATSGGGGEVTAQNGAGTSAVGGAGGVSAGAGGAVLVPDPETVAPPIDTTVATDIATTTAFLYTGSQPIQTGVDPKTIEPKRVAVLRGAVKDRDGAPISGVSVTVLNHPEFGKTLTRADGMFDLVVNGGGLLTVVYAIEGYLTAQRAISVPWRDYVWLPEVVLIPYDTAVTSVDLSAAAMQVARGNSVSDADGARQATVLVPPGTSAQMVLADGSTQALSTLHMRATEYTVGAGGPKAMPAALPPSSGYTYAVELSADEAIAAGATTVRFSTPLPFYMENFIGFPVGGAVPVGYYDRQKGQWIASANGRVVKLVSITDGKADLDLNGDGTAEGATDLTALGITDDERIQVARLYSIGQSLWRVPIGHFSPWDCNWPYGPPSEAVSPPVPAPEVVIPDPDPQCGSIIGCQDQTLGEALPVAGTPFTLHYKSDRTPNRATYSKNIPITGASVPESLRAVRATVTVAGRSYRAALDPAPNLAFPVTWDGKDAYGRALQGLQRATVQVDYDYTPVYYAARADFDNSFGRAEASGAAVTGNRAASTVTLSRTWTELLGSWDARAVGFDGWSLNAHHVYDAASKLLVLGDGTQRSGAEEYSNVITTVAGNGTMGFSGDGGPATVAQLALPTGVAVGPDGSLFIVDSGTYRIRRVGTDGIITTVAGNGTTGFSGDNGPATAAQISSPSGIAIGLDGSIFIGDWNNNRIRRVGTDGLITTVAGNGTKGFSGDGGSATDAQLSGPIGVAVGPDGSLFFGDAGNLRIRRVGTDGIITTVAGNGTAGFSGDGGPAIAAQLSMAASSYGGASSGKFDGGTSISFGAVWGEAVAVGPDGSLFISGSGRIRRVRTDGLITTVAGNGTGGRGGDGWPATDAGDLGSIAGITVGRDGSLFIASVVNYGNRIRRVGTDGIITTVAGFIATFADNRTGNFSGNGGPATAALVDGPGGVAVGPDGSLFIADVDSGRIRRVRSAFPDPDLFSTIYLLSGDGGEVYKFSNGRHLQTVDARTGVMLYQFGYDSTGFLTSVTDGNGNVTSVERTGGTATAIVGPHGQRTTLTVNAGGWLTGATDPSGATRTMNYTSAGLLQHFTDPLGRVHSFTYDTSGRLTKDADPAGGSTALARADDSSGYTVTTTSALGRTRTYKVESVTTGGTRRTNTLPTGDSVVTVSGTDGSERTTSADGTVTAVQYGPDPRWGMLAPISANTVVTTPSGLALTIKSARTAILSNPADLFSLSKMTDTVSINGNTWTTVYDVASRKVTRTSPQRRTSTVTLDEKDRVVKQDVPGLESTTLTYDSLGRLQTVAQGTRPSTFAYDTYGYLTSVTDPLARAVTYQNDPVGRLTAMTGTDSRQVLFGYDANSNMTSLTPPGRPAYRFGYSAVDLETTFTPPSVAAWDPKTYYSYDVDKGLTQVQRPDGTVVGTKYDTAGRVVEIDYPQKGFLEFGYDSKTGQLASALNAEETLTWTYDGRLVTAVARVGTVDGTVGYTYNNDFRLTSTTVNGGNAASYTYDKDGLLTAVGSLTLTRDSRNGMVTVTTAGVVTERFGYNTYGEVTSYTAKAGSTTLLSIQYVRDLLGRITKKTEAADGATTTYDYGYNAANRLIQVQKNGTVAASYAYDANGNRTSETKGSTVTSATYDAQDRLQTYGTATYTFGNAGDLQTRLRAGDTAPTSYAYDALGNLVAVSLPNATQIAYVVDAQGHRVGKTVNGALVQGFIWESQLRIAAEFDASGNVVSRFVYGKKINVPELIVKSGQTYRVITDHLGSARSVVNTADGTIVQQIDYDEWGNVIRDTNPGFQPFGFAGGIYDADTGLVRFGARDYDATTGRWAAKDPVLFAGRTPNLYQYCGNDPLNCSDPGGYYESPWYLAWLPGAYFYDQAITSFEAGDYLLGAIGLLGMFGEQIITVATLGAGSGALAEIGTTCVARTEAANLSEQLTLKEAQAGAGKRIMKGAIDDPSFPEDLWAKMQHVHITPEDQKIVIHYWENLINGLRTGFKFKNP